MAIDSNGLLDDIGRNLLSALQQDARLSYAELGRRIGLSPAATAERLRRLEEAGIITGYRVEIDRERGDAEFACPGVAHDHHGGGAVVERAGVAGSDGAALTEDGLQAGQPLQVGAGPWAVVLRDHVPVGSGDRDDLAAEEARFLGRHRPGL